MPNNKYIQSGNKTEKLFSLKVCAMYGSFLKIRKYLQRTYLILIRTLFKQLFIFLFVGATFVVLVLMCEPLL